jgi:uncharacterized protein
MIRVKTYDCALMSGALPPFLDLGQAARLDLRFSGALAVSSLPRLVSALAADSGQAEVELQAAPEVGGRILVSGRIRAPLQMICQRCLESVTLEVQAEPRLAWVKSDAEMEALSPEYDPLLSANGRVEIAGLVEDELLLALPLAPRHADGACRETRKAVAHSAPALEEDDRKNPFADLAKLKRGR